MSYSGRPLAKGFLAQILDGEVKRSFEFQFNPTEFNRNRTVEYGWLSAAGSVMPEAVFTKIGPEEMTLSLLLDATMSFSVSKEGISAVMAALELFTWPDPSKYSEDLGQVQAPPQALFGLGNFSTTVVVQRFSPNIVRWNRDLQPTRAFVELGLSSTMQSVSEIRNRLDGLETLAKQAFVEGVLR
jgi:hypothetical protein